MGRVFLLFLVLPYLLFSITKSDDQLADLLADLIDTDADGLSYLVEIFPTGEIDFENLTRPDLERLFFLSPDIKQYLWEHRKKPQPFETLTEMGASDTEIALLKLCQMDDSNKLPDIKYYGRIKISEEKNAGEIEGSWAGSRYAQWQKLQLQSGPYQLGLSIQKDAGESSQYDSYNGYFKFENEYIHLGAGSFFASFGTGLVLSSPHFGNYKYIVSQSGRNRFRGYNGADENWPYFGLYGKIILGNTQLGLSASKQIMDGHSNEGIYSIDQSGYHRTGTELIKRNRLETTNITAFLSYRTNYINFGTLISYLNSPQSLSFQNAAWSGSSFYNSVYSEFPFFQLRFEVKTYPGMAINIIKRMNFDHKIVDIKAYYYDEYPNLNSRHIIFNRLPFNCRGINLKWENKTLFNKRSRLSGYFLWEERMESLDKILYFGYNFEYGKKYRHQIIFNNYSINSPNMSFVHRWLITYCFIVDYRKIGSVRLKTGFGSEYEKGDAGSKFFMIRFRKRLYNNLKLILNFAGWNCEKGSQVWLYSDGLPETFSVFNAIGTGTLLHLQLNYTTRSISFYYAMNKQNRWGEAYLGSGSTQIQGSYRSIHYLGLKLFM